MTPAAVRVLEAASSLFYNRGIAAVGVDLIAAEAGVTKKTIYDRFGSKEQLVVEYLRAREARWEAYLSEYLESRSLDPESEMLAIFDASGSWTRTESPRGCSFVNAHAEISDPSHPAIKIITDQKKWTVDLFARRAKIAGLRDPKRLGETLAMLLDGANVGFGLSFVDAPMKRAREAAVTIIEAHRP